MPLFIKSDLDEKSCLTIWKISESAEILWNLLQPQGEDFDWISSISHPFKQAESLAARMAVKQILLGWGLEYQSLQKNNCNKPLLVNYPFDVSISHAPQYAVAFVHQSQKVGIDIEQIRPKLFKIAPKFLSAEELLFCQNDLEKMTILWAGKEAVYKWYSLKLLTLNRDIIFDDFEPQNKGSIQATLFPHSPFTTILTTHYFRLEDYFVVYVCEVRSVK